MPAGTVGPVTSGAVSLLGELFQSGKRPNAFLRLIGGIAGGVKETLAYQFPTSVIYNLRTPAQAVALEGAAAPAAQNRTLSQAQNVIEIHQEAVTITYLAESDKTMGGVVPLPTASANGPVINPRDINWQLMTAIETISQDVNFAFLNGVYANPANASATALQTRGLLTALATNVFDSSADVGTTTVTYKAYVEKLAQMIVSSTGFQPDNTWTIMAGVNEYNNIQAAYESKTTAPYNREIAGLQIKQIYTRMGILNLAMDPDMPAQTFAIMNLGVVAPVGMPVPDKGIIFAEPLARTGSGEPWQIYGQLGLDHGPEFVHGKAKVPVVTL